jgi:hypothetical protein
MLLSTVNPEAAASIGNIRKVGVGNRVVYHARAGYMRDKRASYPADVLRQHEDGSLDLLVHMDREDIAREEHVEFRSHNQPHHCWTAVEDTPGATPNAGAGYAARFEELGEIIKAQGVRIAELAKRLTALEAKRSPGRPRKNPLPETAGQE